MFVNAGAGERFLDVSAATGADDAGDSKGVAFADFDNDGRMDVFVVNQGGAPRLFRNVTSIDGAHWLAGRHRRDDLEPRRLRCPRRRHDR